MYRYTLLLLCLLLSSTPLMAQEQPTDEGLSFFFQNVPLADALVQIDSASTNKRVQFIYDELDDYDVTVRFSHLTTDDAVRQVVGYAPIRVLFTPQAIYVESMDHEGESPLDSLMQGDNRMVELEEVRVMGRHLVFDHGSYLTVVPRPRDVEAAGSGLMLLARQQLPGLHIDVGLQNIKVNGGTPILMVNGKERSLQRVVNLDPKKILRIEYANHPSVRYLDRGATGIINIVLREPEDGGSVVANVQSAFNTGFGNSYLMASYNKGSHEVALEYNGQLRKYDDVPSYEREHYNDPRLEAERLVETESPFYYIANNLQAEYTYQPNDSTMLVASLRGTHLNSNRDGHGTISTRGQADEQQIETYAHNHQRSLAPTLDLFFSHKMAHRQKIELNLVGDYNTSKEAATSNYTYAPASGIAPQHFPVAIDNHGYAVSGEAVYSKSFARLETRVGIQFQHNYAKNDYLNDVRSEMTKDNTYLYAEVQGPVGEKFHYTLGTGVKIFAVDNSQQVAGRQQLDESCDYVRNLTSLNLNYRLSPMWTLQYSGQYQPELPTLSALSPVIQQQDYLNFNVGNESLSPAHLFMQHLTLRFWHEKTRLWFNLTPGIDHTANPIIQTWSYDATQDAYGQRPVNGDYENRLYVDLELGVNELWGHVNVSSQMRYMREHSEGDGFAHTHRNFYSNINVNGQWGGWTAGAAFTLSPYWSLSGERLNKSEVEQTIYAQYHRKAWTFQALWLCPLNPNGYSYETRVLSNTYQMEHKNWTGNNGNMIALGVTYQTNFGKSFQKGQKTLHNGGYDSGSVR